MSATKLCDECAGSGVGSIRQALQDESSGFIRVGLECRACGGEGEVFDHRTPEGRDGDAFWRWAAAFEEAKARGSRDEVRRLLADLRAGKTT